MGVVRGPNGTTCSGYICVYGKKEFILTRGGGESRQKMQNFYVLVFSALCLFMCLVLISRTQSNNRELTSVAMADNSKVFANDKATG